MFGDMVPPKNGMSKGAGIVLIAGQGLEDVEVECGILGSFRAPV